MTNKNTFVPAKLMIPLGLLIICTTILIGHDWTKMPDILRGSLMGIGIGLEIMGLILLKRKPKTSV